MRSISLHFRDTDEKVVDFLPGAYAIGRGNRLKCTDKRISHNHALLHVATDKVTLTPAHMNPCFFKSAEGSNLRILKLNEPVDINDGDTFGFLPDMFWYKVKFCDTNVATDDKVKTEITERVSDGDSDTKSFEDIQQNDKQLLQKDNKKRELDEENNVKNSKKLKTSISAENNETGVCFDSKKITAPEINDTVLNSDTECQNSAVNPAIKQETTDSIAGDTSNESPKNDQSLEPKNDRSISENTVAEDDNQPSSSTTKDDNQPSSSTTNESVLTKEKNKIRDRCWYGASCYRKNVNHKKELSHPGDSDYESDENDDRPACPFGVNCYRRNKTHRQQFKHPKTQGIPKRPVQNNPSVFHFHNCNFYGSSFPFS